MILRNKGEEKLKSEREKLEQIKFQKEVGFKRMENENTILIAEANRLRKYLHEVYLKVVDIEKRFENLTHINPNLSKTEIVYQIKEFIKLTHNNIKAHFAEKEKNLYIQENLDNMDTQGILKSTEGDGYMNKVEKTVNSDSVTSVLKTDNKESKENRNSEYEGLILPPINTNTLKK